MKSFREFLDEDERLDEGRHSLKPWHASKKDILKMWENLRPSTLMMRPVPEGYKGTRFKWDGIRVTGSPRLINSVLARLKDLLQYENNPGTRLDVEYRQIETDKDVTGDSNYVCYIYIEEDRKKAKKNVSDILKAVEPPKPHVMKPIPIPGV